MVGGGEYQIVWTKQAQKQLRKVFEYISQDSTLNALKVLEAIANAVQKAATNPELYNPDKYKINNDGSYRAFEKYHYRISYRFEKNTIRVLRVRHTSMRPKEY